MSVQAVALEVQLGPEHDELLLLALGLLAQVVVPVKVTSEVVVVRVEVLQPVRVAEVAEIMILPEMLEQFLIVEESLVTELTQRVTYKM